MRAPTPQAERFSAKLSARVGLGRRLELPSFAVAIVAALTVRRPAVRRGAGAL
jgi:hypothetical protein